MSDRQRREYGQIPPQTLEDETKAGGSFLPIRLWRRGILCAMITMIAAVDRMSLGGLSFPLAPITWNLDQACGFGAVYGYMCLWLFWRTWSNRGDQVVIGMMTTYVTRSGDRSKSETQRGKVAARHGRTVMTGVCFRRGGKIKPAELPVSAGFMVCT